MSLRIGWAEEDATPQGAVNLHGQYYPRLFEGIHSRLTVTALALEADDGEQAILVSLDLAGFPEDFLLELRERLPSEVPGVDPARVFLNATHTHNAPSVMGMKNTSHAKG